MKMKIAKSQAETFPDFAGAVAAHAADMRMWRAHMARVKADETKGVVGINRHAPYGRPAAHPLVESAVDENDNANFEIVDDSPSDEEQLALRKNHLIGEVTKAERAAVAAIIPPGKARLFLLVEAEVRARDAKVVENMQRNPGPGIIDRVAVAAGLKKPSPGEDIAAAVNAERTDEEQELLAKLKAARKQIAAIERMAAEAHAAIEDLTSDTIDAWQFPDFSKIA